MIPCEYNNLVNVYNFCSIQLLSICCTIFSFQSLQNFLKVYLSQLIQERFKPVIYSELIYTKYTEESSLKL